MPTAWELKMEIPDKGVWLDRGKRTTPVFFFVLLGIIVFFLIYAGVRRSQQTPPPEPSLRQNR